jgi:hypothetical protein
MKRILKRIKDFFKVKGVCTLCNRKVGAYTRDRRTMKSKMEFTFEDGRVETSHVDLDWEYILCLACTNQPGLVDTHFNSLVADAIENNKVSTK